MSDLFPRTTVGGVSLPRMIIGTNWFLGWSHTTAAKDWFIQTHIKGRKWAAEIIEVFMRAGVDAIMGNICIKDDPMHDAIKDAQDRTGRKCTIISTPSFPFSPELLTKGWDLPAVARIMDREAEMGSTFCMPHTSTTDCLIDKVLRKVRAPTCSAR